jgi:hypothetical protein
MAEVNGATLPRGATATTKNVITGAGGVGKTAGVAMTLKGMGMASAGEPAKDTAVSPHDGLLKYLKIKEVPPMKKLIALCSTALLLTIFSTGDVFSAETTKPQPAKAVAAKAERSMIQTFVGRVKAVNVEKKAITIAAMMETEYHFTDKDTLFKEFEVDDRDVTFDASSAKFQGVKGITGIARDQLLRIGYDMKGNTYIAHTVLLIPKRQSRSSIQTFLGKVLAIDPAQKTMTIKAAMEGEFFLQKKNTILKEFVIDERDVTLNTAKATIVGGKTIAPGDTVRVGYDKENDAYIAHTVQKIEKKGK